MADKICPNCLQEWPGCVCVIPIRRSAPSVQAPRPLPHPVLSQQLRAPLKRPLFMTDLPKEFCPDCHRPWQGCVCEGRRL